MSRKSTLIFRLLPRRSMVRSCSTRSSFAWSDSSSSPISSRNTVPPEASSNLPVRLDGGPGKGALFIPEQLGLDQVAGNGGAVDGDERPRRADAAVVEVAGDDFLSRSRLALDQNAAFGVFYRLDRLADPVDLRSFADDPACNGSGCRPLPEVSVKSRCSCAARLPAPARSSASGNPAA